MDNQQDTPNNASTPGWERGIVEKLAFAALKEQRATRRWGLFFKGLLFLYLTALLLLAVYPKMKFGGSDNDKEHTAVIDLVGVIAEDKDANAKAIIEGLREAVKDKHTKGIILHANSPGGSPVQSWDVFDEIRKIKKEHPQLPIYTVVSDICASGCYYIAAASDKIFVNQASIIGSIGVLMDGFGFVNVMEKLGVERRLLTAGAHKAMLDPFSPVKENETAYMNGMLNEVHQQFITAVRTGRGDRLKETPDMFSGLVWSGESSLKLGIADAIGNDDYVAKDIIGAKKLVNFTQEELLMDRIAGKLGAAFGQAISSMAQVSLR
ncbi:MAG: signal peptide peptidase SppA [Methylococcaceae bacterium]|nr:signal peptide peptidase SppA [Methylococcaceae bacterium]